MSFVMNPKKKPATDRGNVSSKPSQYSRLMNPRMKSNTDASHIGATVFLKLRDVSPHPVRPWPVIGVPNTDFGHRSNPWHNACLFGFSLRFEHAVTGFADGNFHLLAVVRAAAQSSFHVFN
jgi:hypothetical protein